jgi:hypothetical protein
LHACVVGGTTPQSFEAAARLRLAELPDRVIIGRRVFAGEEAAFVAGGFIDKFW